MWITVLSTITDVGRPSLKVSCSIPWFSTVDCISWALIMCAFITPLLVFGVMWLDVSISCSLDFPAVMDCNLWAEINLSAHVAVRVLVAEMQLKHQYFSKQIKVVFLSAAGNISSFWLWENVSSQNLLLANKVTLPWISCPCSGKPISEDWVMEQWKISNTFESQVTFSGKLA